MQVHRLTQPEPLFAGRLWRRGPRLCGEQLPGRFDATGGAPGVRQIESLIQRYLFGYPRLLQLLHPILSYVVVFK